MLLEWTSYPVHHRGQVGFLGASDGRHSVAHLPKTLEHVLFSPTCYPLEHHPDTCTAACMAACPDLCVRACVCVFWTTGCHFVIMLMCPCTCCTAWTGVKSGDMRISPRTALGGKSTPHWKHLIRFMQFDIHNCGAGIYGDSIPKIDTGGENSWSCFWFL